MGKFIEPITLAGPSPSDLQQSSELEEVGSARFYVLLIARTRSCLLLAIVIDAPWVFLTLSL
jgi:hypothetical protein